MSYIALYRKWRPLIFEDVVEQEHVVKTLKHSVNQQRIAHAYLFCGTRGTGKTTMAKIFARAINCLDPHDGDPCNKCEICKGILSENILDVIEIDAASNNSVDNIREIRDEVIYAPSQSKYKVYIIDEVHMLSTGAFNALLKTLEEPPSHVVFILATTDPHKLPATILSRCQRFDFRRISVESIMERLDTISKESSVTLHKDAARLIAKMSDGALRDAISILDQCISVGNSEIAYKDVLSIIGLVNDTFIADVASTIMSRDVNRILLLVNELMMSGKDIPQFVSDMIFYYRNLLICKITDNYKDVIEASAETIESMVKLSRQLQKEDIICIIRELSQMESSLKWSAHPRIMLEVLLIKLCEGNYNPDLSGVMERLASLENKINTGNFSYSPATSKTAPVSSPADSKPVSQKAAPSESKQSKGTAFKGQYLEAWGEIINELKNIGRLALYTNLLDTKAVELDNKFIGIVFSGTNGFSKVLVSKAENLEIVESYASKKLGREVHIKCLNESELKDIPSLKPPKPTEEEAFIGKAKDLSERLNIPVNIIDE